MGKIKVTDDCNGIAGLKVIEPAVFANTYIHTQTHTHMEECP